MSVPVSMMRGGDRDICPKSRFPTGLPRHINGTSTKGGATVDEQTTNPELETIIELLDEILDVLTETERERRTRRYTRG